MTQELKRQYERLRQQAQEDARQRQQAAVRRCPELGSLLQERRELLLSPSEPQRKARLCDLDARQRELMEKLGLEENAFEPRWHCSLCQDTGYAGETVKRPCACRSQLKQPLPSGINSRETFEGFDASLFEEGQPRSRMEEVRDFCRRYAMALPDVKVPTLLLLGNVGLGKSYLLNSIAHCAQARGIGVIKLTAYHLMRQVLKSFQEPELMDELLGCQLLCIDDLGTEPMMNNVTLEYLFLILNERQLAGRATALATNLTLAKLQERYSERLFSRLAAPRFTTVIRLEGKDLRLHK